MWLLINFRPELLKKFRNIPLKFTFCFLGRHAFSLPRLLPDRNSTNHRALFQLFASTWRKRCCYSTVRLQGLKDEKHCSVTQSATMLRGFFIGGTWIAMRIMFSSHFCNKKNSEPYPLKFQECNLVYIPFSQQSLIFNEHPSWDICTVTLKWTNIFQRATPPLQLDQTFLVFLMDTKSSSLADSIRLVCCLKKHILVDHTYT